MLDAFLPHEEKFKVWKESGYPEIKQETKELIYDILNYNKKIKMWPHQIEGLLRTIYSYEVLNKKDLLLNIVTGGGKTAIIASVIFWLKTAHNINRFVILTPNTIVRARLQSDFEDGTIFKKFDFVSSRDSTILNDLTLHVMERGAQPTGMTGSGIILGNIQQLYPSHSTGQRNLSFLQHFVGELAIFNDEAHNTPAQEYTNIINALSRQSRFRLDTTATPNRADGREPDTEMIQYYDMPQALRDGIVKSVVVYEPEIKLLELTYTNIKTGEKRKVTELDVEFKEAERNLKPFQWILDPEPMKKQMSIALRRHREHIVRAKNRYKPILFVITMSIEEGEIARKMLQERFKLNTLLVTEESDEKDRMEALRIGTVDSRYEAVVSVLMLREGWDVPEVSTILLLRKFSSPVYGQQVIGRGLRKIIRDPTEPEILSVIDHPRLEHDWLWKLVAVSKIRQGVVDDDIFDPTEDLPPKPKIQTLVNPEKIIKLSDPEYDTDIDFHRIKEEIPDDKTELDWRSSLKKKFYDQEKFLITRTQINEIIAKQLKDNRIEVLEGVNEYDFEVSGQYPHEVLENLLKSELMEMSEELLNRAGYGISLKGKLYSTMLEHIREKFFMGVVLSETNINDLEHALHMMPEIKKNFTESIVSGIVEDTFGQ